MKEIRVDDINSDIVIFAKERSKRPMDKIISDDEFLNYEYSKD